MRGRSLRIYSTSVIKVRKVSSSTNCSPKRARRILRVERIILSQIPPVWLANGGLKCHVTPRFLKQLSIRPMFHFSKALLISASVPLRLIPLSLKTSTGESRLLTNLGKACIKESLVKSCAISICTAWTAKHVNRHPYLFTQLRLCFTRTAPK